MVYRVFVEKKNELANEAKGLLDEIRNLLGIKSVTDVRVLNRYDVEDIDEALFEKSVQTIFSEPQLDNTYTELNIDDELVIAVEFLPGQFDQRADTAAQCIQIISQGVKPEVKSAKVYVIKGAVTGTEIETIKKHLINSVESREASLEMPETLKMESERPADVKVLEGFIDFDDKKLSDLIAEYGLAMDLEDIKCCRDYFKSEDRNPTITEIKMIDTYWSDHCRHTTFHTIIDSVKFEDETVQKAYENYLNDRQELGRTKPVCLMDIATIAVKILKKQGKLDKLDESPEVNACTVKIDVDVNGAKEPWLLLFKNETHNHPTEIEPFGGAATCVGGAIRDPLSGRAYVYGAMRLTGAGDPLASISDTIKGKLPQRTITKTAAAGYSSYGNQIGLATGIVDEIIHPGYMAKRMEVGAVIAAAPESNVRREVPTDGDKVVLLGGATGRDGCGGATGSSKSHTVDSLATCGAEVQKGNAPEERKIQRLFRNPEVSRMIKRCNDFGAGGVSVAIGELADGLDINLDLVPTKYDGLDGTELAISESQERMATVVEAKDVERFLALAEKENVNAVVVATVTEEPVLKMSWRGKEIVNLKRAFLDLNGTTKHIDIEVEKGTYLERKYKDSFVEAFKDVAEDLNTCSKRGLSERFDSTVGAGGVLMPFGGIRQRTPVQAMVTKISLESGDTSTCSLMSWGYNPFMTEASPYHGAYTAVVESVCKLVASGAKFEDVYLSFQEYFLSMGADPKKWGKPFAALLGALEAQKQLGIAAIGGKDSMSGSFEDIHVPPTLISFAVTTGKTDEIVSPEFKKAGNKVVIITPEKNADNTVNIKSLIGVFNKVYALTSTGKAVSCYTVGIGGVAEAIMKMALGNRLGFAIDGSIKYDEIFGYNYGAFILELADKNVELADGFKSLGVVTEEYIISYDAEKVDLEDLENRYESKLEPIFPCNVKEADIKLETFSYEAEKRYTTSIKVAKPKVLIPAFPGTNCEYDSAKAVERAGGEAVIKVIRNLNADMIKRSVEEFANEVKAAQMIFIPGGFSGGDEPDGSAKFITSFFRNQGVTERVMEFLNDRDGLMCGICNGFQALIKLGLVPYGKIIDTDENSPTLTYNVIGRHQSKIVRTRIASNKSPWLANTKVGEIYNVPISHGEGRFIASDELVKELAANGQIATQYVDLSGHPSKEIQFNPNGSTYAIEGITSPDGRVFGKMGHAERIGKGLYKNVVGNYDIKMFEAAVKYFK
ncbi:MAG: phosphoribosylformylglycinamidine synthase [Eubacteriales bacterium]|nr:phosphoribosylformylglycinamidine synthase [Eubacteriales bacterium]MDY3332833.1 phosphoribosylformylglycinamidine synthase [Gallibacter sp.]